VARGAGGTLRPLRTVYSGPQEQRRREDLLTRLEPTIAWPGRGEPWTSQFVASLRIRAANAKRLLDRARDELAVAQGDWAAGEHPWLVVQNAALVLEQAIVRAEQTERVASQAARHLKELNETEIDT
jgi:hypothetical protein